MVDRITFSGYSLLGRGVQEFHSGPVGNKCLNATSMESSCFLLLIDRKGQFSRIPFPGRCWFSHYHSPFSLDSLAYRLFLAGSYTLR